MRKFTLALALAFFTLYICAQTYTIGTQSLTWTDPARSNRSVAFEIRYPGTNSAVVNDSFPFIVFGHGFQMTGDNYYSIFDSIVKRGYIVVLAGTETSLSPSHTDFGKDFIFLYNKLISEAHTNASSPFYHHVISKGAIAGHSMGGGATVLSCQYGTPATCYFTFSPANTNPACIPVAHFLDKPYLAFTGSRDCIAPTATNATPMYDSATSPCKVYVNILNATHCQFGSGNFQCNFGEGVSACASTPLSRTAQISKCLIYLNPFLDYYLKGSCPAWTQFESVYNSNTVDTVRRNCVNTVPTNAAIAGTPSFCSGASTTLTANPTGFQYVWNDNSTAGTLNVNASGNYSVIVGNGTCSLSAVSVSVTENFPPATPSSITVSDTVCSAVNNINISVVNDASATTYNWTLPSGWNITSGTNTHAIQTTSGSAGGTISVVAQNSCGASSSVSKTIVVQPSPGTLGAITSSDTFCSAATNLSISVPGNPDVTSYTWSLPSGWNITAGVNTNSIQVTAGSTGGTISVSAQNSCGTTPSVTKPVVVQSSSLGGLGAITAADTVCSNIANLNLSVPVNAAATSYTWTLPAGWNVTSGANSNSIQVTSGTSGGTISVTAQNNCGATVAVTKSVIVVPSNLGTPGIISGADTLCGGQTSTFSIAPVSGANSYVWSFSAGWSASNPINTNTIQLTANNQGGTVSVSAVNGCGTSIASSLSILVDTIPVLTGNIVGPDTICVGNGAGTHYTPSAIPASTTSYNWSIPNDWSFVGAGYSASPIINVASAGTLSVNVSNQCGASNTLSLNVALIDTPNATVAASGNALIASPGGGGYSYKWYLNGQIINGANGDTYTPTQSGNYSVVVSDIQSCQGRSSVLSFVYSGLQELNSESSLRVFPNPAAEGFLQVRVTEDFLKSEARMYDAAGRIVLASFIGDSFTSLDISSLSAGIYVICIEKNKKVLRQKVVIE